MFLLFTRPGRPPPYGEFSEKSMCFWESRRTMYDGTLTSCLRTLERKKKSQLHQFNPRAWDILPFSFSNVLVQITFSDEPNGRFSKCCWPLQLLWCLSNHTHLNGALLKPFQNKCKEKSRISLVSHNYMTVSGNLLKFLKQSDSKLNPIVTWSFTFPVAVCLFLF